MVRSREKVGESVSTKLTVDDYEHLPDDGIRYEILDGALYMTPAPVTEHQRIVGRLFLILHRAIGATGLGEVFVAPFDVELDRSTIVQPDLCVILAEHRERITPRRLVGPPDVAIEILSASTAPRDLVTKRELYLRFGVPWYWVVDPERRDLSEYGVEGGRYVLHNAVEEPENFTPAIVPGFIFSLTELFTAPAR